MAAQAERARLARDMHDSLAKTVSGIGFAALALARRIERDPQGAADEARRLAEDARAATREARELITGLRDDDGRALPLAAAAALGGGEVGAAQRRRASRSPIEEVGELDAVASRELEWILREALRNVERHAHASSVAGAAAHAGRRARCSPSPTTATGSTRPTTWRSSPAGATSGSSACASARSWPAAT